mmetsp:Transcript_17242/g.53450  ORF Transcript_17242/g.53450 Transcript_17242/m.53450 type:complete len:200 (+) Transcript_17242:1985-2584(+)
MRACAITPRTLCPVSQARMRSLQTMSTWRTPRPQTSASSTSSASFSATPWLSPRSWADALCCRACGACAIATGGISRTAVCRAPSACPCPSSVPWTSPSTLTTGSACPKAASNLWRAPSWTTRRLTPPSRPPGSTPSALRATSKPETTTSRTQIATSEPAGRPRRRVTTSLPCPPAAPSRRWDRLWRRANRRLARACCG